MNIKVKFWIGDDKKKMYLCFKNYVDIIWNLSLLLLIWVLNDDVVKNFLMLFFGCKL